MLPETAELVDPIFERTWRILDSDSPLSVDALSVPRSELKELLSRVLNAQLATGHDAVGDYLGSVYPLVCWIDEIMTDDERLGHAWNENKLEGEWFGSNDRAWMFWRQAALAETIGRRDDLAIFYLCVQLGFTGQYRTEPEKLAAWSHRTQAALGLVPELQLPFRNDLAPATDAPPLVGAAALRRASHVAWMSAVVLLPVLSYLTVTAWAR